MNKSIVTPINPKNCEERIIEISTMGTNKTIILEFKESKPDATKKLEKMALKEDGIAVRVPRKSTRFNSGKDSPSISLAYVIKKTAIVMIKTML